MKCEECLYLAFPKAREFRGLRLYRVDKAMPRCGRFNKPLGFDQATQSLVSVTECKNETERREG